MFALFLQLLFSTAHLSALAVAATLGGPTGERLGFLQICTAQGLRVLPADSLFDEDNEPAAPTAESCLLCGMAAVDGVQLVSLATVVAVAPIKFLPIQHGQARDYFRRPTGFLRAGSLRGPPIV